MVVPVNQPSTKKSSHMPKEMLPDHFMHNIIANDIYQYSILSVPHGPAIPGLTVEQISKCGDHGIGIFEGREGELIYIGGKPFQVAVDEGGYVNVILLPKICATPITFFMGVDFEPQIVALKEGMNVTRLGQLFRGRDEGTLKEAFTTFKVHGLFENVSLRVTGAATQPEPFSYTLLNMAKRIPVNGNKGHVDTESITGTIFGFCAPEWAKELCWSGIKCWFDAPPKSVGEKSRGEGYVRKRWTGHVAEFKTKGAVRVEWAVAQKWHWQTNDGKCFGAARPDMEDPKEVVVFSSSDEDVDSDEEIGSEDGSDSDSEDHSGNQGEHESDENDTSGSEAESGDEDESLDNSEGVEDMDTENIDREYEKRDQEYAFL
jgi:alpha-acetolactate decarboxylase